jgi:[ribosomal protein S5]-alanine N-acetyltransferase
MHLTIRPATIADLDTLFHFQTNEEARQMAAFTPENWNDKDAYTAKWTKLINEGKVYVYCIIVDGQIAGTVGAWQRENEWQITYWIDRAQWGKGVATEAVRQFLQVFTTRPIYGSAAFDNHGSLKVLEKCGFKPHATDKGHANARGREIEEVIYKLG